MKTFQTKVVNVTGDVAAAINEEGRKGWRPVNIEECKILAFDYSVERDVEHISHDVTFQREVGNYQPSEEVAEALNQIRNARLALRHELGVTRQGSCGSALRKAEKLLSELFKEEE
jgi:hypothetical protein